MLIFGSTDHPSLRFLEYTHDADIDDYNNGNSNF